MCATRFVCPSSANKPGPCVSYTATRPCQGQQHMWCNIRKRLGICWLLLTWLVSWLWVAGEAGGGGIVGVAAKVGVG